MSHTNATVLRIFRAAAVVLGALASTPAAAQLAAIARPDAIARPFNNEQEWIVSDISATIVDLARAQGADLPQTTPGVAIRAAASPGALPSFVVHIGARTPVTVTVVDHIWSASTYRGLAKGLMPARPPARAGTASPDADPSVRAALTNLTSETLLDANDRVSAWLARDPFSASGHESAALLLGAFALRESSGWFQDIRPALSRMTAHLATARVLRNTEAASLDGQLAEIVMNALIERERHTTTRLDAFEAQGTGGADVAWARALRMRVTGNWRNARPVAEESVLEQLEHGRAVRDRLDIDEFMDYVEQTPWRDELPDWARLAYKPYASVEAGHHFGSQAMLERELASIERSWRRFHGAASQADALIHDLNDRPGRGGPVLDWGLWAGHHQRHLLRALTFIAYHQINLGRFDDDVRQSYLAAATKTFGTLTLYPVMLRGLANDRATYERSLKLARPVVMASPELVSPGAWHLLLEKPAFMSAALAFPLDTTWFTPTVPAGTALELQERSLRPDCPRPPTEQELAAWAVEQPHGRHTQWSHEWQRVPGKPALKDVRRAMAPLFDYDGQALFLVLQYMEMPVEQRIELAHTHCDLIPAQCERLGELALLNGRQQEALAAYERWHEKTRDRVGVSNGVTWLMRYYLAHGQQERADAITTEAADTGSARGMEVRGEFLERIGRDDEAETFYREIGERYAGENTHLGLFLMRRALKSGDRRMPPEAAELLRPIFAGGLEPLVRSALPAAPTDGVAFLSFGARASATGLKSSDVIVGIDGWRVHNTRQSVALLRISFEENVTLTVWRGNKYETVKARIPERWFGTRFAEYRQPAKPR